MAVRAHNRSHSNDRSRRPNVSGSDGGHFRPSPLLAGPPRGRAWERSSFHSPGLEPGRCRLATRSSISSRCLVGSRPADLEWPRVRGRRPCDVDAAPRVERCPARRARLHLGHRHGGLDPRASRRHRLLRRAKAADRRAAGGLPLTRRVSESRCCSHSSQWHGGWSCSVAASIVVSPRRRSIGADVHIRRFADLDFQQDGANCAVVSFVPEVVTSSRQLHTRCVSPLSPFASTR